MQGEVRLFLFEDICGIKLQICKKKKRYSYYALTYVLLLFTTPVGQCHILFHAYTFPI